MTWRDGLSSNASFNKPRGWLTISFGRTDRGVHLHQRSVSVPHDRPVSPAFVENINVTTKRGTARHSCRAVQLRAGQTYAAARHVRTALRQLVAGRIRNGTAVGQAEWRRLIASRLMMSVLGTALSARLAHPARPIRAAVAPNGADAARSWGADRLLRTLLPAAANGRCS